MTKHEPLTMTSVFRLARSSATLASEPSPEIALKQRVQRIRALKNVILRDREYIMDRIQAETGKCRTDALMSEIFPVLDHLHYLEKKASKILKGRFVMPTLALLGKKSRIYLEPMGVTLIISPWNYPFYQALVPCTSAFIVGNSVIYKPSEHTPLQGLFEELLEKAEFEKGAIQVVYGDGAVAVKLIEMRPDKIFFTGSVGTGKKIMAQAAQHLIPVELELGGKDPMIVFEDANLKRAVAGAIWGALTNCGQSCTSVERIYVHEAIYPEFRRLLLEEVGKIKQGVDADGNSDVGRMTTEFQVKTVAEHVREAQAAGARLLTGTNWDFKSKTIPPLVLENVTDKMRIITEETFGPVLPLITFKKEHDAIVMANNSRFALSASVWTKDPERAYRVTRHLVTGNVSVNNVMLTEANPGLPFGGSKESGFGRYKGEFGLYAFSNIKSVLFDKDSAKIEANWFPYTREKYVLFTEMMVALFTDGFENLVKFIFSGLKLESYSAKATRLPAQLSPAPDAPGHSVQPEAK